MKDEAVSKQEATAMDPLRLPGAGDEAGEGRTKAEKGAAGSCEGTAAAAAATLAASWRAHLALRLAAEHLGQLISSEMPSFDLEISRLEVELTHPLMFSAGCAAADGAAPSAQDAAAYAELCVRKLEGAACRILAEGAAATPPVALPRLEGLAEWLLLLCCIWYELRDRLRIEIAPSAVAALFGRQSTLPNDPPSLVTAVPRAIALCRYLDARSAPPPRLRAQPHAAPTFDFSSSVLGALLANSQLPASRFLTARVVELPADLRAAEFPPPLPPLPPTLAWRSAHLAAALRLHRVTHAATLTTDVASRTFVSELQWVCVAPLLVDQASLHNDARQSDVRLMVVAYWTLLGWGGDVAEPCIPMRAHARTNYTLQT